MAAQVGLLAAVLGSVAPGSLQPITAAAAAYPPVTVYVGYADNLRASPFFPNPWEGSGNTNFIGVGPTYDSGAIRIDNPTTRGITVADVSVSVGNTNFDLWGSNSVAPRGHLVLAQTSSGYNFDTSDVGITGCTNDRLVPVVRVTINGIKTAYRDTRQVLNTGGIDKANCVGANESHQWQVVGGGPTATELQGGGSPSIRHISTCSDTIAPVNCATGEFYHRFGDLSVPGRGIRLDFSRTYSSSSAPLNSPLGYGWTDSYNMFLSIDPASGDVTVNEETGSQIVFTPTPSGLEPPSRVIATLVQNSDGSYLFKRWNGQQFAFDGGGLLTAETDRNGYQTSVAHSSAGLLTSVTDPEGRSLSFSYSGGLLTAVTDPANRQVSFTYDTSGNLVAATDASGGLTRFTYDANHFLLTMVDPNGGTVTNGYDGDGRVATQSDPMNRTTAFSYTPTGTTITDPRGVVEVQQYDNNELQSLTRGSGTPQAATWSYAYDPDTLGLTSITDPNGHIWSNTYDASGNLLAAVDPLNRQTTYAYDALNNLTAITDALGVTTSWSYDSTGNLVSVSRPLAGTSQTRQTSFAYGDSSHPGDATSSTDGGGRVSSFSYDTNGDLVTAVDPLGNKTTRAYDAIGRLTSTVSPKGNVPGANASAFTTSYSYDAISNLLVATDPLGHAGVSTYDANRNRTSITDPGGHRTAYTYDADNEVTKVTRPDGSTLGSSYDADGNLISQVNGLGNVTNYAYDPLNRVVAMTDGLNRTTSFGYDGAGNRISLTDPAGQVTTKSYDPTNELTGVSYSDGKTPPVSYGYDADGRRISMSDGTGTSTYSYDSLDRLTRAVSGSGQSVGYAYDLMGRLTSLTYPNGQAVSRSYDAGGRLTAVADWLGHTTGFSYDPNGNLVTDSYPNTVQASYVYDAADQLASITDSRSGAPFASYSYSRNPNGQLTGDLSSGLKQPAQSYSYDQVSRLSGVNTSSYAYDAADEVTKVASGANLSYDAASELTGMTRGGVTTSFTYDSRGNRLAGLSPVGTTATYSYDQANRLTGFQTTAPAAGSLISGGGYHSLATRSDGTAWSWGYNVFGQLGNGTTVTYSSSPVQVSGLVGVTRVAAGNMHSLALRADGSVWAWGYGGNGQLGNGATANSSVPVQVSGLAGAMALAAGANHGLAVKGDGTVVAWGNNSGGELGNGTTVNSSIPVAVLNLTGVSAVAGGGMPNPPGHSLALKSDGTVWAWGNNKQGQLGNGSTSNASTPVAVKGLTGVIAIAAGGNDSYALKGDGSVWAWGDNSAGQLGNSSAGKTSTTPVQVTISAVTSISGGGDFGLAVKSDGSAWGWGDDATGQLGDGGACGNSCKTPVQTKNLSSVAAVSGGYVFSLGVTVAGSVVAWGQNGEGQLGNGTTTASKTPVATTSFGTVKRAPTSASYTYDGDGRRGSKTVAGATSPLTWDLVGGFSQLLTDGTTNYIYGPGGLAVEQIKASGSVLYLHQDQIGSTRLITDGTGAISRSYSYDPFGNLTALTGTQNDTPLGYAGQYTDSESGFSYMRARYYEPLTGQFVTADPMVSMTRRPYAYATNDPLNRIDPTGLYDYTYTQYIGTVGETGGAAGVMAYLQQNFRQMFPFSTGACDHVVLGEECILQPAPLDLFPSDITVTSVTATSFTFTSGAIHVAGAGGTITFRTFNSGGAVYLQEIAHAPNANWWENIVDPKVAWWNWQELASNIRRAVIVQPCPPTVPLPILIL